MPYQIDIQNATQGSLPVTEDDLVHWVGLTLEPSQPRAEVTLRIVDAEEMIQLNGTYRNQAKTTNVLAFPSVLPKGITLDYPFLGDLVICPAVLQEESIRFEKSLVAHWAHIVIHGILHLLGYDHIIESDERIMQAKEITILAQLGFENPYE